MKTSTLFVLISVLALVVATVGIGEVIAQCNTADGCGDANCSHCSAKASTAAAGNSSCSASATTISLKDLTPDEITLVKHIADLIENSDRVEFDTATFSKATGLSEDTIGGMDQDRIQAGILAELNSRGFDTSNLSFGAGNCSEFGACSVDANLARADGEMLSMYEAEKNSSGQPYMAWKAPDFTLPTTDGDEVTLSDYIGAPVAVAILAMHCNHCVDTLPMLASLRDKHGSDIVILPVVTNAKSIDAVNSWGDAVGIDYPLLVSTDKSVSEQFKTQLVPTVVLINEKGYVTRKLITFQSESQLDIAIGELTGKVTASAGGSR